MKRTGLLLVGSLLIAALLNYSVGSYADAQSDQGLELTEIGQMETTGWAASVHVQDDTAYVSASEAGLYIIDISNPDNPTELSRYNESIDHIHDIYVEENLVYLADYTEGLKIIDVSDLENPTLVGEFHDGGEVGAFEICEDFAFLADFEDGLEIVNITDPTHPQESFQYDTGISYIFNVEVNNDLAYVPDYISASEKALKILNISDLSSIEEIAEYTIDGEIFSIDLVGDIAYMMCSYGGVKIFNISNPDSLVEIGGYYDGGNAVDLEFFEDYMIIADRDDGLEVLTAKNSANITEIGRYFDGGSATNLEVVDDLVFVADGEDGLEILQIEAANESTSMSTISGEESPFLIGLTIVTVGAIVVPSISAIRQIQEGIEE